MKRRHSFPGSSLWLPAEEIIIARAGRPVARLVPYRATGVVRRPGAMRGKIRIKKNFDEPLPKELLGLFAGKS